jgi:hypothetical protein
MTDAGHRARCPYRCGDEAATHGRENARPRYAYSGSGDVDAVVTAFLLAATELRLAPAARSNRFLGDGSRARCCGEEHNSRE